MSVASTYWENAYFDDAFNRSEWQAHPLSLKRLWSIQGEQSREDWFYSKYIRTGTIKHAVSIGAGRAETEIEMLRKGYVDHFILVDIAAAGINHAKERATQLGFGDRVTCKLIEPGVSALTEGTYDLVMHVASLHHMDDIGEAIAAALNGLKPGGFLWCANEYVGPNRFGYPKEHVNIVERYYSLLPLDMCKHQVQKLVLPTPEEVAAADPSEAPRSEEIVDTFARLAPDFEMTALYGSFAFIIFWGLEHNSLYETEEGRRLMVEILRIDQALVEANVLPTYFAHLVAHKKHKVENYDVVSSASKRPWRDSLRRMTLSGLKDRT